jgi:hypothetical protein
MIITTAIPGVAATHAQQLLDRREEAAELQAIQDAPTRRRGRGTQAVVTTSPALAAALADRFAGWAQVERDVRFGGDGASSSIERACETAAQRLREAMGGTDR